MVGLEDRFEARDGRRIGRRHDAETPTIGQQFLDANWTRVKGGVEYSRGVFYQIAIGAADMRLALIPVVMLLAACSTAGATAPASPTTRVDVKLSDALRIEPAAMTVPAGVPVTFVITNNGATEHEFYLGDEAAQGAHEKEMAAMGGMTHDEPAGVSVKPGQTKELTFTFATARTSLAGCHVNGHYGAGMKASITVVA